MPSQTFPADITFKPRVLIADDSRIVRATLIKHIQGMFDFREATDGERAWEMLLLDPTIRVLITDLTMPKLDGYGLLHRIRHSKIDRIRKLPVVAVSGSDEDEERERARAAGATDLVTKGMATAHLLSRLDVLARLVQSQHEYERSLQWLAQGGRSVAMESLASPFAFQAEAESLLDYARRHQRNFLLLSLCVGARPQAPLAPELVQAIGVLLKKTVRSSDSVARTGEAEFTLASGNINLDGARGFAQRLCGAISAAQLPVAQGAQLIASCGVAALEEQGGPDASLNAIWETARRRGALGLRRGHAGVIGAEEEMRLLDVAPA